MRIMIVTGADGAPFVHDLASRLAPADELTVVAPTVRGHVSAGLQASPDLDALLARPAAATYAVTDALEAVGYVPAWQRAADHAIAARLIRTDLVANGASLTDATIAAAARAALPYRLLPACEGRAEFRVVIGEDDQARAVHVEDYLADPAGHQPTQLLLIANRIAISPAVSEALTATDVLVLGPSSRTLAVDPVLRTPGFLELVRADLPVIVVDHEDPAPADLVRVAGLREADPGAVEHAPADPAVVLDLARKVTA